MVLKAASPYSFIGVRCFFLKCENNVNLIENCVKVEPAKYPIFIELILYQQIKNYMLNGNAWRI
jgi:hypothetical protein